MKSRPSPRYRPSPQQQLFAGKVAPFMFALALLFLVGQAVLVVTWVDMPSMREQAAATLQRIGDETPQDGVETSSTPLPGELNVVETRDAETRDAVETAGRRIAGVTLAAMLVIWPLVVCESVYHWYTRPWDRSMRRFHFYGLLSACCPSLRMCARCPELGNRLWLPGKGWRKPDRRLRRQLERHFSMPMILIAMLILPVLAVEFFLKAQVAQYVWLRIALHVGTGVIWFAFAAEFILMVSVAEKKLVYLKEHWIDLAIILLPLFSFLRSLQALRGTRLANLARVPQVSKLARAYRLRGTAIRALRALVLLDLIQRVLRTSPQRRIEKMSIQARALEKEARKIRVQIAKLERELKETEPKTKKLETPEPELTEVAESRIKESELETRDRGSPPPPVSRSRYRRSR